MRKKVIITKYKLRIARAKGLNCEIKSHSFIRLFIRLFSHFLFVIPGTKQAFSFWIWFENGNFCFCNFAEYLNFEYCLWGIWTLVFLNKKDHYLVHKVVIYLLPCCLIWISQQPFLFHITFSLKGNTERLMVVHSLNVKGVCTQVPKFHFLPIPSMWSSSL